MSTPLPAWGNTAPPPARRLSRPALWSLIVGVLAIPVGLIVLDDYGLGPFIAGVAAVLLGLVALSRIGSSGGTLKGRWMAWIGIVLGGLAILIGAIVGLLSGFVDLVVWFAQIL